MALAPASVSRASLWVSATGDDSNPGTEERPLGTLGRARDIVRTMNRDMSDDVTVFIGGTFHLYQPIEFGPEDSGTNGFSVIYMAAPGEHPVISGACRVTGWSLTDKSRNLWSARAPEGLRDTHDLWVNGSPAERTRGRFVQALPNAQNSAPAADPRTQWKNPGDVVFASPAADAIWSERSAATPHFVENAYELLGKPGEWYFDRPAGKIFYTPRSGEDLATADVEAAAARGFIIGKGSRDHPLLGLVFKGIRFEFITGLGPSPAAVRFTFAGAVQFLEDDFVHLGAPALDLGPGFAGGTIEGCLLGDISWTALKLNGASDVRITDSRFSYVATQNHEGSAVELVLSGAIEIEHNQFDHFPNAAIATKGEPSGENRIARNLTSLPMFGFAGALSGGDSRKPISDDEGITAPYRAILDERFGPRAAPHPPSAVSAEAEEGFAYVTWDPPCLDGGPAVASYTVTSSFGASLSVSAADFASKGYIVFDNLEDRVGVSFTVVASNLAGASPPSIASASVVTGHKRRLKAPQGPTSVSVVIADARAKIQLTPPASTGRSPVVAYTLSALPSGKHVLLEGRDILHSDAAHPVARTVSGFRPDPGDTVSVTAMNANGDGQPAVVKPQR